MRTKRIELRSSLLRSVTHTGDQHHLLLLVVNLIVKKIKTLFLVKAVVDSSLRLSHLVGFPCRPHSFLKSIGSL